MNSHVVKHDCEFTILVYTFHIIDGIKYIKLVYNVEDSSHRNFAGIAFLNEKIVILNEDTFKKDG